jgi:peptide deformylase
MRDIVQEGNPVLRKRAEEIPVDQIPSNHVQTLIQEMIETLAKERLGAALAAPQIAESYRLFIVSPDVLEKMTNGKNSKPLVCINPEIISRSKAREELHEGCLSLRGWWGYVPRSDKVTLRAYDEHGKEFERGASGLLAQIFQHEVDHLNGTLYIDNAHDMHTDEELKRREDAGIHGKQKKQ